MVFLMSRPHHSTAPEYAQHLTWTTRGREPVFLNSQAAEICVAALEEEREFLGLDVYGYVLMPDHIHLVVWSDADLPGRIVQGMKISSAFAIRDAGILPRSPWARGYWDRAIRTTADLVSALNYVHANPVKAGIAKELCDYKFSSFGVYHETGSSVLQITRPSLIT